MPDVITLSVCSHEAEISLQNMCDEVQVYQHMHQMWMHLLLYVEQRINFELLGHGCGPCSAERSTSAQMHMHAHYLLIEDRVSRPADTSMYSILFQVVLVLCWLRLHACLCCDGCAAMLKIDRMWYIH